jgi:hypothetical protein
MSYPFSDSIFTLIDPAASLWDLHSAYCDQYEDASYYERHFPGTHVRSLISNLSVEVRGLLKETWVGAIQLHFQIKTSSHLRRRPKVPSLATSLFLPPETKR